MKDSSMFFNYLKEKKELKEKYEQLQTQLLGELNTKYQIDQYLLEKKYEEFSAGWNTQREIIGRYLKEKEEKKVQEIKDKEKELEGEEPREVEKLNLVICALKEELKHIRSLKDILSDFKNQKEGKKNGGNHPKK